MRFLADESCDFGVVRALRSAGYDVKAVIEASPGVPDDQVLELARHDERILLTEDKDFGQLVFAASGKTGGAVLIRFPASNRDALAAAVTELCEQLGERLTSAFVTLTPKQIRVSRLPGRDT